jgi:acyl-CoA synthetase (NDP forming)
MASLLNPKAIAVVGASQRPGRGTSVVDDPRYGPAVVFGLGGIFVEILKDATTQMAVGRAGAGVIAVDIAVEHL